MFMTRSNWKHLRLLISEIQDISPRFHLIFRKPKLKEIMTCKEIESMNYVYN